jgi:hypothetical protein
VRRARVRGRAIASGCPGPYTNSSREPKRSRWCGRDDRRRARGRSSGRE